MQLSILILSTVKTEQFYKVRAAPGYLTFLAIHWGITETQEQQID